MWDAYPPAPSLHARQRWGAGVMKLSGREEPAWTGHSTAGHTRFFPKEGWRPERFFPVAPSSNVGDVFLAQRSAADTSGCPVERQLIPCLPVQARMWDASLLAQLPHAHPQWVSAATRRFVPAEPVLTACSTAAPTSQFAMAAWSPMPQFCKVQINMFLLAPSSKAT